VMDMLFPPGTRSRIPIAAITGTNGKTTTSRMLAHIMKSSGKIVGMTSTDGVYVDGKLTVKGDMTGPASAQMVLRDPSVDFAVMETARGGLVRSGLGYQRCDVSACLNVTSDHLGMGGINTLEELAVVKRVVVETATDTVVLNADDMHCLRMADFCHATHICYVTMNSDHPLVKEHIRAGGRAVVLEKAMNGDMITVYSKGLHLPVLWSHLIPATLEGKALYNVQNAMFACAMAFSLELDLDNIRHGLRTFDTSFFQAPGRTNVFDEHPFKVILDYAHNPAAIAAMAGLADRLDVKGRRLVVAAMPGDRRNEDIVAGAKELAGHFDHFYLKPDDDRRSRNEMEVPTLMREILLSEGVKDSQITLLANEVAAIDTALAAAQQGDLLVIFADELARSWKQIIYFKKAEREAIAAAQPAKSLRPAVGFEELLASGETLIRDERGVRLAKGVNEDAD
jgi:cyanophycin synthetase